MLTFPFGKSNVITIDGDQNIVIQDSEQVYIFNGKKANDIIEFKELYGEYVSEIIDSIHDVEQKLLFQELVSQQQGNIVNKYFNAIMPKIDFVGRNLAKEQIRLFFEDSKKLLLIKGLGGNGKSSLIRQHLHQSKESILGFSAIFWWSFYDEKNLSIFLDSLFNWMSPFSHNLSLSDFEKLHIVKQQLLKHKYIIVLDGFEVITYKLNDSTKETNLIYEIIDCIFTNYTKSKLVVTSRSDIQIYNQHPDFVELQITGLSKDEMGLYLEHYGFNSNDNMLELIQESSNGHTLSLELIIKNLLYNLESKDYIKIKKYLSENAELSGTEKILEWYQSNLTFETIYLLRIISLIRISTSKELLFNVYKLRYQNKSLFSLAFFELEKLSLIHFTENKQINTHAIIRESILSQVSIQDLKKLHFDISQIFTIETSKYPDNDIFVTEKIHHGLEAETIRETIDFYENDIQEGTNFNLLYKDNKYSFNKEILKLYLDKYNENESSFESFKDSVGTFFGTAAYIDLRLGNIKNCENRILNSILIKQKLSDVEGLSTAYNNLTQYYIHLGYKKKALDSALKSLEYSLESKNKFRISNSYSNLGFTSLVFGVENRIVSNHFQKSNDLLVSNAQKIFKYGKTALLYSYWLLYNEEFELALSLLHNLILESEKKNWKDILVLAQIASNRIKILSGNVEFNSLVTSFNIGLSLSNFEVICESYSQIISFALKQKNSQEFKKSIFLKSRQIQNLDQSYYYSQIIYSKLQKLDDGNYKDFIKEVDLSNDFNSKFIQII